MASAIRDFTTERDATFKLQLWQKGVHDLIQIASLSVVKSRIALAIALYYSLCCTVEEYSEASSVWALLAEQDPNHQQQGRGGGRGKQRRPICFQCSLSSHPIINLCVVAKYVTCTTYICMCIYICAICSIFRDWLDATYVDFYPIYI